MESGPAPAWKDVAAASTEFWEAKGWSSVALVALGQTKYGTRNTAKLFMSFLKLSPTIKIRTPKEKEINDVLFPRTGGNVQNESVTVLVTDKASFKDCKVASQIIAKSSAYSVLLITKSSSILDGILKLLKTPVGFYLLRSYQDKRISKVVATRTSKEDRISLRITESSELFDLIDMAGAFLMAKTLPYKPFLFMKDCSDIMPCHVWGLVADIMEQFSLRLNFTYSVYEVQTNEWDDLPESLLSLNESKSYSSVASNVFLGNSDLGLSVWSVTPRRLNFFYFPTPIIDDRVRCFASLSQVTHNSDMKFLLTPFASKAWICLLGISCAIIIGMLLFSRFGIESSEDQTAGSIMLCAGGLAFTVTMGYYSGSQTMLLATRPSLPFDDLLSGILSAQWKVLIVKGDDLLFRTLFPEQLESNEKLRRLEEHMKQDTLRMKDALGQLYGSKRFIAATETRVGFFLKNNPEAVKEPVVSFCPPLHSIQGLILPKNSPFKEAINHGILQMRQTGVLETIARRWRGNLASAAAVPVATAVDVRQTSVALFMGGLALVASLVLLSVEKVMFSLRKRPTASPFNFC